MRGTVLGLCFALFGAQTAFSNEISINITGSKESNGFDGKPICKLKYDITNNSTGTIYYLSVSVDGWDDRGTELDEGLGASLGNADGFFGRKPIAVGATLGFKQGSGFETKCDYMGKIKVMGIKPEYCNIRMLPEDVNCEEIVKVTSELGNVTID